jgi:hypothetical protein
MTIAFAIKKPRRSLLRRASSVAGVYACRQPEASRAEMGLGLDLFTFRLILAVKR